MQKMLHFFASIYISLNYGRNVAHCVCSALISAHMAQLPAIFGAYRIPPESYPCVVGILPIHAQGVERDGHVRARYEFDGFQACGEHADTVQGLLELAEGGGLVHEEPSVRLVSTVLDHAASMACAIRGW